MSRQIINKHSIDIGQYTFEKVDNFKYLGVNINANNSNVQRRKTTEIRKKGSEKNIRSYTKT